MDADLELKKPIAREIVRRLMDAWRLRRAYKYRSEKRTTQRKLYFSLMKELLLEVGQRDLRDIIMQRINFFNHNFLMSLSIDQFEDLISNCKYQKASCTGDVPSYAGQRVDESLMEECTTAGNDSDDNEIDERKKSNKFEVVATDALRSLLGYQYDPEQDSEAILLNLKEMEKGDVESNKNEKSKTHFSITEDETASMPKDGNLKKAETRNLFIENELLRIELQPMLIYKDDPDMHDRIIAPDIRGKNFKVSNDGRCPRCHHSKNVFVILDFLFPMGDMPDICSYLIAKGQAVLWSSQDDSHCKDPPTILCRGRCPADPAKCGFNLNWNRTDLETVFFFPREDSHPKAPSNESIEQSKTQAKSSASEKGRSTKDKKEHFSMDDIAVDETKECFDERLIDFPHYKSNVSWVVLDELSEDDETQDVEEDDQLIKTMLAISSAKEDWDKGEVKLWSGDSDPGGESMEVSHNKTDLSPGQQNKQAYAFSWKSYGSNPWAPVDLSSKRHGSKSVPVAKDKPNDPNLLDEILPHESVTTNESVQKNQEGSDSSIAIPVGLESTDEIDKSDKPDKPDSTVSLDISLLDKQAKHAPNLSLRFEEMRESSKGKDGGVPKKEKKHYTAADYPISDNGICPYCKSADVVYVIIENSRDDSQEKDLPDILRKLLQHSFAYKMRKDENELPSFQCLGCTYGFNLDWGSSNLDTVFGEKLKKAENQEKKTNDIESYSAKYTNQRSLVHTTSAYGYQMPPRTVHPSFIRPHYTGFFPTIGPPPMVFAPGFVPAAIPRYFPGPGGFPGHMPGFSDVFYQPPYGLNQSVQRRKYWKGGQSFQNRNMGAQEANRCNPASSKGANEETTIINRISAKQGEEASLVPNDKGKNVRDMATASKSFPGCEDVPRCEHVPEGSLEGHMVEQSTSNDETSAEKADDDCGLEDVDVLPSIPGIDEEKPVVFTNKEERKWFEDRETVYRLSDESDELLPPGMTRTNAS